MDESRYGALLSDIRPRIIETPEEHERVLSIAESLMEKGDALSPEERELLALLVLLVEAFESNVLEDEPSGDEDQSEDDFAETAAPHVMLRRLMTSHNVDLNDVVPFFGNPNLAKEVLEGIRPITRGQAKELGRYFRVPAKLFQD